MLPKRKSIRSCEYLFIRNVRHHIPSDIFRRPVLTFSPRSFFAALDFREWLWFSSWHNNMRRSLANRCMPISLQLTLKQAGINAGISRTQWLTALEIIWSSLSPHDFLKSKYSAVMSFAVWQMLLNALSDSRVPSASLSNNFTLCTRDLPFAAFSRLSFGGEPWIDVSSF
jgi:hypothetical protein